MSFSFSRFKEYSHLDFMRNMNALLLHCSKSNKFPTPSEFQACLSPEKKKNNSGLNETKVSRIIRVLT